MKQKLKILIILLANNIGFAFGNCFEPVIEELAKSIDYPELGYFENIILQFKIDKGNLKSDSTFETNRSILYREIVQEIEKIKIKTNCPDIPNSIRIRFELKWENSINYKNGELIISNNSLAVPTKSFGFYCSNASINDEFEKGKIGTKVIAGDNVVFVFYRREYDNPFIPEEQQKELIYFQIPNEIEEFEYIDEELETLNLCYENFCVQGCGIELIKKGKLKGKLESKTWIIDLNFKNREFKFNLSENSEITKSK